MTERPIPHTPETQQSTEAGPAIAAPRLVLPALTVAHESAYRTAHDLLVQRQPAEALAVLEPALAQDPTNRGLRILRAWAHFIRVQLHRAEDELRSLVEEDPTDVWSRHTLGRTLERQARYDDALPHLRLAAAMTDDPEHHTAVLRVERRRAERAAG